MKSRITLINNQLIKTTVVITHRLLAHIQLTLKTVNTQHEELLKQ